MIRDQASHRGKDVGAMLRAVKRRRAARFEPADLVRFDVKQKKKPRLGSPWPGLR
jgi:hypothetical protein